MAVTVGSSSVDVSCSPSLPTTTLLSYPVTCTTSCGLSSSKSLIRSAHLASAVRAFLGIFRDLGAVHSCGGYPRLFPEIVSDNEAELYVDGVRTSSSSHHYAPRYGALA